MAQVIEFCTLARFAPTVKWAPDEQRGKIIPFMSQGEVSDELVCAAYEELDSESSRWPERDEAPYQAALEQIQPLRLEEETFWRTLRTPWRSSSASSTLGLFSDGSLIRS
jgi:hypothetical protein